MAGFGTVFSQSPAVIAREIDLSAVITGASSSIGGFAGEFSWGPVATSSADLVRVSDEKELVKNFGSPTKANAKSFFTAASFLKYSNTLLISRAVSEDALNSVSNGSAILVQNENVYEGLSTPAARWVARFPGDLGNSLRVSVCSGSVAFDGWEFAGQFNNAPGSSEAGDAEFGVISTLRANDEIHVVIVDEDGLFTGTKGTILEKYEGLSLAVDAKKPDGTSIYYRSVIDERSSYVYAGAHDSVHTNAGLTLAAAKAVVLALTLASGGRLGYSYEATANVYTELEAVSVGKGSSEDSLDDGENGTIADGDVTTALDLFVDSDNVDVSLLFADPSTSAIDAKLYEVTNARKDLVGFISAPVEVAYETSEASKLAAVLAKFNSSTYGSSSYIVFDSGPLYVYDKYHDEYIWIPAAGHMAGLCANVDTVAETWFSPAGFNRGQLLGVAKLGFNPNKVSRDALYKARINPIVSFPGEGVILFGDKTAQTKSSAFDRINVRRLFNILKKTISRAAKYTLFELNDDFTRSAFKNMVEPYLRDIQGRRGVTSFAVICDETNNTPEVIDTNQFVGDIFVAPSRSIGTISLNFIATRTGVNFSEIVGGQN